LGRKGKGEKKTRQKPKRATRSIASIVTLTRNLSKKRKGKSPDDIREKAGEAGQQGDTWLLDKKKGKKLLRGGGVKIANS